MAQAGSRAPAQGDKSISGQAQNMVDRVTEQANDATEGMQEVASNLKGAVNKSVADQPMATLAVAAALGFVLGAIWKA